MFVTDKLNTFLSQKYLTISPISPAQFNTNKLTIDY